MPRVPKYRTADDLLANCTIKNDCFIWPAVGTTVPVLANLSPIAMQFHTTSIARILFTICRHPPARGRLIHVCNEPFCVNPYHHIEAKTIRKKRVKYGGHNNALLPEQEVSRDKIAPPEEVLLELRPRNPVFTGILANSAATAGTDGSGILNRRAQYTHLPPPRYADKPIFKLTRGVRPPPPEKTPEQIEADKRELEEIFSGAYLDRLIEAKRARTVEPHPLPTPEWASKTR